eukprot:353561-Chlamydomonas_euryale.AAC.8
MKKPRVHASQRKQRQQLYGGGCLVRLAARSRRTRDAPPPPGWLTCIKFDSRFSCALSSSMSALICAVSDGFGGTTI